jgi:hypothetical protein
MTPVNQLRVRVDPLNWRIEASRDADEARLPVQECNELARAVQRYEDKFTAERSEMEAAKMRPHRLNARL